MATDKGVIEGYTGVAAVDAKHQIIADAHAHGTGSQQELLLPVIEALAALHVTALIADPEMRQRNEIAVADGRSHGNRTGLLLLMGPIGNPEVHAQRNARRIAGMSLYHKGARTVTNGNVGEHLRGARRDCAP